MQKQLNLKVKYRRSFRPFAPSILIDDLENWFDIDTESPYMLLVANIKEKHAIKMSNKQKSLFGIDKLNVKDLKSQQLRMLIILPRIQTVHQKQIKILQINKSI